MTFAYSGNLYSINPTTGAPALVGPSGLGGCPPSASSCAPTTASTLGNYAGNIYATDFQNSLYSINPVTGAATLIGPTGIPAIPFVPGSMNPDGTFNLYDEAIFGGNGNLYITYDAFVLNFNTFSITSVPDAPELYKVNPITGAATPVGPTDLGIGAVTGINGVYYAFNDPESAVTTLNLTNGDTSFVTNFDYAAGVVQGAVPVPTPEPSSLIPFGNRSAQPWRHRSQKDSCECPINSRAVSTRKWLSQVTVAPE